MGNKCDQTGLSLSDAADRTLKSLDVTENGVNATSSKLTVVQVGMMERSEENGKTGFGLAGRVRELK